MQPRKEGGNSLLVEREPEREKQSDQKIEAFKGGREEPVSSEINETSSKWS